MEFSKLIELKRLIKIKNQNKISKNKILSFIRFFGSNLSLFKKRKISMIVNRFVNNEENNKNNGKQEMISIEKKRLKLFFLNLFNLLNISARIFF